MKRAEFEADFEDAWREAMVKACKLPDAKERMVVLRRFKRDYEELEELDPWGGPTHHRESSRGNEMIAYRGANRKALKAQAAEEAETEANGDITWREVISPDGVLCYVTRSGRQR